MDLEEFAKEAYNMIDYVAHYVESVSQRRVVSDVSPGFLYSVLPSTAPSKGAKLSEILDDIEKYILPGLSHSLHPGFHAFFPSCPSFVSTIGTILADSFSHVGFNWSTCPSRCELELIVVDWYGKLIGLPGCFLQSSEGSRGAGILVRSTSECIFLAMVTARRCILRNLLNRNPSLSTSMLMSSLVVYCSEETQDIIQRIAVVCFVNVRVLRTMEDHRLSSQVVEKAMTEDEDAGLIPFFTYISVGSKWWGTSDPVNEIGYVCKRHGVWMHVDASYAGNAMICPEFRHLFTGVEYASSVNSNPDCWIPEHVDCAVMFVKDKYSLKDAVFVDRSEYGYNFSEKDWGYPNTIEFRSLSLWMVLRSYGVEGIQEIIRRHIRLAEMLEDYIRDDDRFELISRNFGIVCFRLVGSDDETKRLKLKINETGKVFVSCCPFTQKYAIRFVVCTERSTADDIKYAWKIICEQVDQMLNDDDDYKESSSPSDIFKDYYKFNFL